MNIRDVGQVGLREVGAREVGAREVGAREVGAREVGAREVGAREVGAREFLAAGAELVIARLEEAGSTLLVLPQTGYSTKLRSGSLEIVRSALETYGSSDRQIRPAVPSAAQITRMDEALAWITLIPRERHVLRRIVGARALVNPMTERHLFSWRRLATVVEGRGPQGGPAVARAGDRPHRGRLVPCEGDLIAG